MAGGSAAYAAFVGDSRASAGLSVALYSKVQHIQKKRYVGGEALKKESGIETQTPENSGESLCVRDKTENRLKKGPDT